MTRRRSKEIPFWLLPPVFLVVTFGYVFFLPWMVGERLGWWQ